MSNPEIGTPEFRARNRGNLEWRGEERTVNKALSLKYPTRAAFLYGHRIITGAEKDLAETVMNLATLAGKTMKSLYFQAQGGRGFDNDYESKLYFVVRKLGSRWGTIDHHFLAELRESGAYRTSIPHPLEQENIRIALDRVDTAFYEWGRMKERESE